MACYYYTNFSAKLPQLFFKPPTTTKKGSPVVYIAESKDMPRDARIQVNQLDAPCTAPFGVTKFDKDKDPDRQTLDLTLGNVDQVKFWESVDEHVIQTAIKNKALWFKKEKGKDISDNTIRDRYCPLVKLDDSDKKYDPMLHTKINVRGRGVCNVHRLDDRGRVSRRSDIKYIEQFSKGMFNVKIQSVWFQPKQFGMSLITTHAMLIPREEEEKGVSAWNWGATTPPVEESDIEEGELVVAASNSHAGSKRTYADTDPESALEADFGLKKPKISDVKNNSNDDEHEYDDFPSRCNDARG